MKAKIHITGQIGGNFTLLRALNNGTKKEGMFNSFYLYFNTIGEAKKAMREGWRHIKLNSDSLSRNDGLNRDASSLCFDASQAIITPNN